MLKKGNTRLFYSLFRKNKTTTCDLSISDFFEYFKSLVSDVPEQNNGPEELTKDCFFEDLELAITADEIIKAIHEPKRDQSHGPDCFRNEYFIEYKAFMLPYLCSIYSIAGP